MIEKTIDVWVVVWVDSWEYLMVLLSVVVLVCGALALAPLFSVGRRSRGDPAMMVVVALMV